MLWQVGVPTPAVGTFCLKKWQITINLVKLTNLCPLMNNSYMLSQVWILLSTGRARAPELVVHIHNVSLQVCLQIASVATVATLEVFQLKIKDWWRNKQQHICEGLSPKSKWQVYLNMLLVDVVSEVCELLEAMGTSVFLLLLHIPEKQQVRKLFRESLNRPNLFENDLEIIVL